MDHNINASRNHLTHFSEQTLITLFKTFPEDNALEIIDWLQVTRKCVEILLKNKLDNLKLINLEFFVSKFQYILKSTGPCDVWLDDYLSIIKLVLGLGTYEVSSISVPIFDTLKTYCHKSKLDTLEIKFIIANLKYVKTVLEFMLPEYGELFHGKDAISNLIIRLIMIELWDKDYSNSIWLLSEFSPAMLSKYPNSEFLENIWLNLAKNADDTNNDWHFTLIRIIFTSFPESSNFMSMINDENFWKIMRKGLLDSRVVTVKQAIHTLKLAVNYISNFESTNVTHFWDSKHRLDYKSWWMAYMNILENTIQTQSHVVAPSITNILTDLIDCNPTVNVNTVWVAILVERGLQHELKQARIATLKVVLQSSPSYYWDLNPIVHSFIKALSIDATLFSISNFNLAEEFFNWLEAFKSHSWSKFCSSLVTAICHPCITWNPVSLYYVMSIFSNLDMSSECWVNDENLKPFILRLVKQHSVVIRSAIQCDLIKMLANCQCDNPFLFDYLVLFNEGECLVRGTSCWDTVVNFVKVTHNPENYTKKLSRKLRSKFDMDDTSNRFVLSPTDLKYIVTLVAVGQDAFNIFHQKYDFILFVESISNADFLLLECQDVSGNYFAMNTVLFYAALEDTFSGIDNAKYLKSGSELIVENFTSFITDDLRKKLIFATLQLFLQIILEKEKLASWLSYCLDQLVTRRDNISDLDNLELHSTRLPSEIYSHIGDLISNNTSMLNSNELLERAQFLRVKVANILLSKGYLKNGVDNLNSDVMEQHCLRVVRNVVKNNKNERSTAFANYWQECWLLLLNLLRNEWTLEHFFQNGTDFIEACCMSLDLADEFSVNYLFDCVSATLILKDPLIQHDDCFRIMSDFIIRGWNVVLDLRRKTNFFVITKHFIDLCFDRTCFTRECFRKCTSEIADGILNIDENTCRIRIHLLLKMESALCDNRVHEFTLLPAIDVLISIFCVSSPVRKDLRFEQEAITSIRSRGNSLSTNQLFHSEEETAPVMRCICLRAILKLFASNQHFVVVFCRTVLNKCDYKREVRYFSDSSIHRIRHRYMQALLICEYALYYWKEESLVDEMWMCCVTMITADYGQQPSVRYQLEWLMIRLLVRHSHLRESWWTEFDRVVSDKLLDKEFRVRPAACCSFISVAYHASFHIGPVDDRYYSEFVRHVLPCCMNQHFTVRLYAQTLLPMLFINAGDALRGVDYRLVHDSLLNNAQSMSVGNVWKNSAKLAASFYFRSFDAFKNFTLQTIFYDLPRLSANIAIDEWINVETLIKYVSTPQLTEFGPPMCNSDPLPELSDDPWSPDCPKESDNENILPIEDQNIVAQKKFEPLTDSFTGFTKKISEDGLVVVATLVDKACNLGGICRTCDVLGVSQLVIANRNVLNSKEFTGLSLTAEKHLPIIQVKRGSELIEYLKRMKSAGYCLIGVEQTTHSKPLHQFQFPKKSLLLLGNEKEGLPCDLLSSLDEWIEVPQLGTVRSLNVHVCTSLFIWQYTQQHHL